MIITLRELGYSLNEIGVLLKRQLNDSIDFRVQTEGVGRSVLIEDLKSKAKKISDTINSLSRV